MMAGKLYIGLAAVDGKPFLDAADAEAFVVAVEENGCFRGVGPGNEPRFKGGQRLFRKINGAIFAALPSNAKPGQTVGWRLQIEVRQ